MKIKTRIRIGVVVVMLVLAVVGVVIAVTFRQVRRAENEHDGAHSIVGGIFELNILTYDYIMHPGERARVQWSSNHAAIGEIIKELDCSKPLHMADVKKMREDHMSIGELFARLVGLEAGDAEREQDAYVGSRATLVTQLLMRSNEMEGAASRLAHHSKEDLAGIWRRFYWAMIMSMTIIAVVMVGVSFLTGRSVTRPVWQLQKGTEIIGAGNLDFRVGTDAKDEIGELSRAFDRMTASLATSVTERKRVEDDLRRTSEHLEKLINCASALIIVWDPQFRITRFNHSFEDMTGFKQKEVTDLELGILFPEGSREKSLSKIKRTLRGEYWQSVEIPILCKDGRVKLALWNSANIYAEDGKTLQATIAQGLDITERKQAMEETACLEEQLRQSQKMEAIGSLAGGVAHDFNNYLTGIIGFAQLLLERSNSDPRVSHDLGQIRDLADRAADLTRQLLAFSRKQPIKPVVLNINSLVENMSKMLKRLIGEDIDIEYATAPNLGNVRADPGQVEQVLLNIAINARDAMSVGGALTIETANMELDEAYCRRHPEATPGPHIMLAVSDTGLGMDAETRRRIFEPFFTTKELGIGTGLGLATVYGIVKQHGGNIWVYSEPGKGTTFKIYLPEVQGDVRKRPRETAAKPTFRGSETILIAEDENAVLIVSQRTLERRGYKVLTACNPDEAEKAFNEANGGIHLLLTDVVMPIRSGKELFERLQIKKPGLKVLYMSGYADNAIVHAGKLGPGTPFIEKPFSPKGLAKKVREVLDGLEGADPDPISGDSESEETQ